MKKIDKNSNDALSSVLLKLQYHLVAKKYGSLAALFVKSVSVKELTEGRLLLLQPALAFLSQWISVSNLFSQLLLKIKNNFRFSFKFSLSYEVILFLMQGTLWCGFIALGVEVLYLDVELVFFVLFVFFLVWSIMFLFSGRSFIRFGYLCLCSCVWISVMWIFLDLSTAVGS